MGPPPAGMTNFKPKSYPQEKASPQPPSYDHDDYDDDDDDEYYRKADDRNGNSSRYDDDSPRDPRGGGRNYRDTEDSYDDRDRDRDRDTARYRDKSGKEWNTADGKEREGSYNRNRYDDYDDDRSDRSFDREEDKPGEDNNYDRRSSLQSINNGSHSRAPAKNSSSPPSSSSSAADVKSSSSEPQPNGKKKQARATNFNFSPILRATYRELKNFVTSPCPEGYVVRCYIERNRSYSKMLAPQYSICADLEDGTGRELMVCKKIMQSRSSHYIFSLKADDLARKREQRSRLYLGKLRATSSNDFVLYDNGICSAPDDDNFDDDEEEVGGGKGAQAKDVADGEVSLYRKELISIHLNSKTRPAAPGVRGTEVCIPNPTATNEAASLTSLASSSSSGGSGSNYNVVKAFDKIRQAGKQNELHSKSLFILHERTSRYDPLSSCLVDFKGRANVASVKNCQFVQSTPLFGITEHGQPVRPAVAEQLQKADADKVCRG